MRNGPGFFNGLITIAIVTVILVWMVTTFTNGDALWFLHLLTAEAETVVIYWDGESYTLYPGDPGFNEIMATFTDGISHPAGFEWGVAFSEQSISRYHEEWKLLEVNFAQPVQVHTRHPFAKAKTYLVPLEKTHSYWRRAFSYPGLLPYTSGPLDLEEERFNRLYEAVERAVQMR